MKSISSAISYAIVISAVLNNKFSEYLLIAAEYCVRQFGPRNCLLYLAFMLIISNYDKVVGLFCDIVYIAWRLLKFVFVIYIKLMQK